MRISRFQKTMLESNKNVKDYHKKMNVSRILVTSLELFSQYGIIIFYLLGVDWSSISLSTIAEITANLVIVETALGYVSRIAMLMSEHREQLIIMKNEEEDIKLILDVFIVKLKNFHQLNLLEKLKFHLSLLNTPRHLKMISHSS